MYARPRPAMRSDTGDIAGSANPNGTGVPKWPAVKSGGAADLMYIDVNTKAGTEKTRDRYLLLDKISMK